MKKILFLFLLLLSVGIGDIMSQTFNYNGLKYTVISESNKTVKTTEGSGRSPGNSVSGDLVLPETVYYGETPYTLTEIGSEAFRGCSALTSVEIPNSVRRIGSYAFQDCGALTSVTIPNSVWSIGNSAFIGCNSLIKSAYPDNLENPFPSGLGIKSGIAIKYPADNSYFEDGVIYSADKSSIYFAPLELSGPFEIPNSVTTIGSYAFYGCSGLTSVIIPNSVTYIGSSAFSDCNSLIKSAYPDKITNPFSDGIAIKYPANNSRFEDGVIYSADKSTIYFASLEVSGPLEIPNSVTSIGGSAFLGCSGLTSVEISNLEAWCNIVFGDYSANPLYYAHLLYLNEELITDLKIPDTVTSIGDYAFYGCSGLTSVEIPNSVTSIGRSAFDDCSGLTGNLNIPNSVTYIGDYAFRDCSGLTSIEIPNSITSIGSGAFYDCSGLTSVTIPNSVTSIGNSAFSGCSGLTSVEFNAENCTTCGSIDYPAFPSNVTTLTIGNQVKNIPTYAFRGCSGLTGNLNIPNSVTSIGSYAFSGCSGLTGNLNIPNSVTEIRQCAFSGCRGLTGNLNIPNSVTYIGSDAFWNCSGLTSVTIGNSVTSIGKWAFEDCSGLTSVTIGKSVTEIGNYAFYGCTDITNLYLGEKLTTIGSKAFADSKLLDEIVVAAMVPPTADNDIFSDFTYTYATLFVPERSINSYKALAPWSNFFSFKNLEESGVEEVGTDADETLYDVFNLNGQLVKRQASQSDIDALAPGIYIIGGKKIIKN